MSDWTNALVVRDRLGQLRHAGGFLDGPITAGLDPLEAAVFADTFGPLVPILGRTGLPVVTTVGDLTARHIGRRVRWHKCDALIESINTNAFHPGEVMLIWRDMHMPGFPVAPAGATRLPLEEPCGLPAVSRPDRQPARWRVKRRNGWSTVTHPIAGMVLSTRDHAAAIAYADRLARQETR